MNPRWLAVPVLVLVSSLAACRSAGNDAKAESSTASTTSANAAGGQKARRAPVGTDPGGVGAGTKLEPRPGHELAAFAGGCFWGTEDTFRQVPGVTATAVGYTGGQTSNPTYEQVSSHKTGHAETVLVEFDPAQVSYEKLLGVFFTSHDPTTMNRQGPDVGSQYRSAVFTFNDAQANAAKAAIANTEKTLGKHVVTQVTAAGPFWKAEEYHQQYDEKTGTHSCPLPSRGT
ncbi:Peptide methionine sulfoxide reductase MsrA [Labilithrix luteola]|uniref:Peptide methionine sulfoxide reductase MsrA n=1 Tax=Labilithrix luteola TaxID=1391654 RepID=A0A0K1Q5R1_9BACT|nr:peptide-methionine (S)-S-oxide reductase MsrA [Labilithrix luteola]AKV00720.1 Peptide methionine sulfoxide reductase MsrA [Labilithrix luteola]